MSLSKCYACKQVVSNDAPSCAHCGTSFRPRPHSSVAALCLLAIACALAYPIVTGLYQ
jgi:hypothetical protein